MERLAELVGPFLMGSGLGVWLSLLIPESAVFRMTNLIRYIFKPAEEHNHAARHKV